MLRETDPKKTEGSAGRCARVCAHSHTHPSCHRADTSHTGSDTGRKKFHTRVNERRANNTPPGSSTEPRLQHREALGAFRHLLHGMEDLAFPAGLYPLVLEPALSLGGHKSLLSLPPPSIYRQQPCPSQLLIHQKALLKRLYSPRPLWPTQSQPHVPAGDPSLPPLHLRGFGVSRWDGQDGKGLKEQSPLPCWSERSRCHPTTPFHSCKSQGDEGEEAASLAPAPNQGRAAAGAEQGPGEGRQLGSSAAKSCLWGDPRGQDILKNTRSPIQDSSPARPLSPRSDWHGAAGREPSRPQQAAPSGDSAAVPDGPRCRSGEGGPRLLCCSFLFRSFLEVRGMGKKRGAILMQSSASSLPPRDREESTTA